MRPNVNTPVSSRAMMLRARERREGGSREHEGGHQTSCLSFHRQLVFTASSLFLREAQIYRTDPTFVMTLPVAVLAALTASAATALTPSHGYAASFAGGRPIAAAVVRDGAHQDLQFPGMRVVRAARSEGGDDGRGGGAPGLPGRPLARRPRASVGVGLSAGDSILSQSAPPRHGSPSCRQR